ALPQRVRLISSLITSLRVLVAWVAGAVLVTHATYAAPLTVYAVNSGGGAASPYVADAFHNNAGNTGSVGTAINTSGVTNPAPQAVYQSERWGPSTYTFPSLSATHNYTVRLHFAETYWGNVGNRKFNVLINGTQVLTEFDIVQAAGSNF